MKPETNNEMDLLLRRLARRDGASASDAAGDHLDADELNAYAENAVPAKTRARYTAHLVECTRCRELVVQLSASAGVVIAATVSKPSTWRTFLASLFTPMVLRYAAPALGLIVVAAIGFVVLRRDQPADHVTQVTNNEQRPTPVPTVETVSPGLFDPANHPANQSPAAPAPSAEAPIRGQKNDLQAESAPAGNAAPVVSAPVEVSKDATAAQPKPEQQTVVANEPPPAKAAPAPTESPSAETEAKKKETTIAGASAPASQTREFRVQERADRNNADFSSAANRKAGTADKAQAGAGSAETVRRERMYERDENAETRSVAGRRFRKQGGAWVDTAYASYRDTMTITRGSEQYRALIADEPEIKTIADQLDGEIIVVWKSRAYRIR